MFTVSSLGCAVLFLTEEQNESYMKYSECAPQVKKVLSAKRTIGVANYVGQQDSLAEELK